MTLMERRRALMEAQGQRETWDYIWRSQEGLPNDHGATLYVGGSWAAELTSDGVRMTAPGNGQNYIAYRYSQYNNTSGIIEVEFTPNITSNGKNLRIAMSNGTSGGQTEMSKTEVKIYNGSSICPFVNNAKNVARIHLRGTVWDFYLNGNLKQSDIPLLTQYTSDVQVMFQGGGTNDANVVLHSIKIKEVQSI